MRETYDCALVLAPGHGTWLHDWMRGMERQSLRNGHPRLYPQEPAGDPSWLASSCLALRRFDACLLPVESATLSWVRTALAAPGSSCTRPCWPWPAMSAPSPCAICCRWGWMIFCGRIRRTSCGCASPWPRAGGARPASRAGA